MQVEARGVAVYVQSAVAVRPDRPVVDGRSGTAFPGGRRHFATGSAALCP